MATLAHLSDLHLGESPRNALVARRLVEHLLDSGVDHVALTGDVTHGGQMSEYELYLEIFAPLLRRKKLTVVPGNHDRAGDGVAELLSDELRVSVDARDGLFFVCVDSTAAHNRRAFRSHGALCEHTLASVDRALELAPRGATSAVLLHHHVLPLPVEGVGEWFADRMGWPHAGELPLGRELLRRILGRCDLVLHGHRHVPREFLVEHPRVLRVANAGSSTALGAYRVYRHEAGRVEGLGWQAVVPSRPAFTPSPEARASV
jgi:3',5'-cyclic AMP phosphodiesterase CpdA